MIIHNRFIPPKPFLAINLFGHIFIRKGEKMSKVDINHELIHSRQQREMLYLLFFIWYVVEWCMRLIITRRPMQSYYSLLHEREAYKHMYDVNYLKKRKPYAWLRKIQT